MAYDLSLLKTQVKNVLDHSDSADYKVDKLLERWERKKWKLIQMLKGELIIESDRPITMDIPDEDKVIRFYEYLDDIEFSTMDVELRVFLFDQGWEAFYANTVRETWSEYGKNIPKGMRITRALKFFLTDPKVLDKWQTRYSRLIQDVKINGKMCISIHPLDYLSISETTHHWRSCHSLDGEYRSGNLSYMNDGVTIVAYLKSQGETKLPNFPITVPWNSKKWRMLFYINGDNDLIFSSKPYPFDNACLVQEAYRMIEDLVGGIWPENYDVLNEDEILDILCDNPAGVHFNDCLSSATYLPRYKCARGNDKLWDCEPVMVGSKVMCLKCEEHQLEFGADYCCVHCGSYQQCTECGAYLYDFEAEKLEGHVICPSCYDELVVWCDSCGKTYSRENPEMIYDSEEDVWHCPKCYDKS